MHIIEEEIKQRDKTDSTREIAPLKKAVDAFKIDVSTLTIDQVFNTFFRIMNDLIMIVTKYF